MGETHTLKFAQVETHTTLSTSDFKSLDVVGVVSYLVEPFVNFSCVKTYRCERNLIKIYTADIYMKRNDFKRIHCRLVYISSEWRLVPILSK